MKASRQIFDGNAHYAENLFGTRLHRGKDQASHFYPVGLSIKSKNRSSDNLAREWNRGRYLRSQSFGDHVWCRWSIPPNLSLNPIERCLFRRSDVLDKNEIRVGSTDYGRVVRSDGLKPN
jgi:hypothetical protein